MNYPLFCLERNESDQMPTSPLGEYIHRNDENYLKYGTARFGGAPQLIAASYNAQRQKNNEVINNIKEIKPSILRKLENALSGQKKKVEIQAMAKASITEDKEIENFSKRLVDSLNAAMLSENTKGVFKSTFEQNNKFLTFDQTSINIEEAKRIRKNFYDNINRYNKDLEKMSPESAEKRLLTIKNNFNKFFEKLGLKGKNGSALGDSFNINGNMLASLKEVMSKIQLADANVSTYNGRFGEILVNSIDKSINQKALSEVKEAEKILIKAKTGEKRTEFQMDETIIPKAINEMFQDKNNKGTNLYQLRKTQDKVDASITFKEQPIEASIKAYTSRGSSLRPELQEVRLLTSLATTEKQFANHWISLHCNNVDQNDMRIAGWQKLVDTELKRHLSYEALAAGNLLKKSSKIANTFIVIDMNPDSKKSIYAYSIKDLLQSLENFSFRVEGVGDLSNIIFINAEEAPSSNERIYKILSQIHRTHVIVSYKIQTQKRSIS